MGPWSVLSDWSIFQRMKNSLLGSWSRSPGLQYRVGKQIIMLEYIRLQHRFAWHMLCLTDFWYVITQPETSRWNNKVLYWSLEVIRLKWVLPPIKQYGIFKVPCYSGSFHCSATNQDNAVQNKVVSLRKCGSGQQERKRKRERKYAQRKLKCCLRSEVSCKRKDEMKQGRKEEYTFIWQQMQHELRKSKKEGSRQERGQWNREVQHHG